MVKLKVKMGEKGQILIPKIFRVKYGMREGEEIAIEPKEEGILLKGRPSRGEALDLLKDHAAKLRSLRIVSPKLGELKGADYQEMEFDEKP
jgi:AbrB family looped-hinge helix DNA binding protein